MTITTKLFRGREFFLSGTLLELAAGETKPGRRPK